MGPACTHYHGFTRDPHYQVRTTLNHDIGAGAKGTISAPCRVSGGKGGKRSESFNTPGGSAVNKVAERAGERKKISINRSSAQISEATFRRAAKALLEDTPGPNVSVQTVRVKRLHVCTGRPDGGDPEDRCSSWAT